MDKFIYLYRQGTQHNAHNVLGAHREGERIVFRVYAPNATTVSIVGDFNQWKQGIDTMRNVNQGIWEGAVLNLKEGQRYKFAITDQYNHTVLKADPFGYLGELRPNTASVITNQAYEWNDEKWFRKRSNIDYKKAPINVYEVHLSSWIQACTDDEGIDMKATAEKLVEYCKSMHYTHIELLPVTEYPLDASWGYHVTGYFALSGRYQQPKEFKYFVDLCHQAGIGVILDWVPGHFCPDEHGLRDFDGTALYGGEVHPHWGSVKFDFSQKHVWSFLLSSAVFWVEEYHIDGFRVDGVSSMLDLNYGYDHQNKRNGFGGTTDLNAKDFLMEFNRIMHEKYVGFLTFAEEATDFPRITGCIEDDGLGFDYKWNMGWMNDTLDYYEREFEFRKYHHHDFTFSMVYAQSETFILPFSHDEVVHGKKQLIDKMPGSYEQMFAGLRTMIGYQMCHPGKKLNFMCNDFAQKMEWRFYEPLEYFMLKYPIHDSFHEYIRALNELYINNTELYELDHDVLGFEWIDADNTQQSVFVFLRRDTEGNELVIVINNIPYTHYNFRIGVPKLGKYKEIFSSNLNIYDGTGIHNESEIKAEQIGYHQRPYSIECIVPELSITIFKKIN